MYSPQAETTFRFLLADSSPDAESAVNRVLVDLAGAPPFGDLRCPAFLRAVDEGPKALQALEDDLRHGQTFSVAIVHRRLNGPWDGLETISRLWEFQPDLQVVLTLPDGQWDGWPAARVTLAHPENLVLLPHPWPQAVMQQSLSLLVQKWAQFNEFCQRMQDLNTLLDQRALKLQAAVQRLEREVAERRAAESRFSAAFRASPCAMAILSIEDGRVLDANDPFFNLLNQHPHSILGRSLDAYPALDEAASRACARALMPGRRNADSIECDFQAGEGDTRRVLLSAETVDLPGGAYVLLTLVDLTKLRRLEKQVEIVREVYRLDDLVGGVARSAGE